MIDEKLLKEVHAMQAANPGMSYEQAWTAIQATRTSLPSDLGAAAREIQASCPGLSFEEAWDMVEREALPHLRKGETMGQALIRARQTTTTRTPKAPAEVKAIEDDDWPKGKTMLIRGGVGTWVD